MVFKRILSADFDLRTIYEVYTLVCHGDIDLGDIQCATCKVFKKKKARGSPSKSVCLPIFLLRIPGCANHEAMLEGLSVLQTFCGQEGHVSGSKHFSTGYISRGSKISLNYLYYCTTVWMANRIYCG